MEEKLRGGAMEVPWIQRDTVVVVVVVMIDNAEEDLKKKRK
jgi:hypothetical protein